LYIRQILQRERNLPKIDLIAIVAHVLSIPAERIFSDPDGVLDDGALQRVQALVAQRQAGKPLAYLTNRREFFSEPFYVDERVLVPRPETELLVEEALAVVRAGTPPVSVLDMGTGSGVIGILLAKGGADHVVCSDISRAALSVARRNAHDLGACDKIRFVASDLFSAIKERTGFDLICANLPYIASDEWDDLMVDVRCYEPRGALWGGHAGTELYERCIAELPAHVRPGACVLFEIGGPSQAERIGALMTRAGFTVAIRKDCAGRERVIKATWTSSS
jgi:release factor glutamine methyltransferase